MIGLLLGVVMMAADTNRFAVCATLPRTSDTTTRTIYGLVSDPFTRLPLPSGFSGVVAEAVRDKLKVPADLPIVVFDPGGRPTIVVMAAFSVMANGTTRNVEVLASSSSQAIDSVLTDAIEAASRDSSYPPLPPRAGNGIRLTLELSPDSAAGAVPMFTVHVPIWRDYAPPTLRTPRRGQADTVVVTFVVDETGTLLLRTVHAVHPSGPPLTQHVFDWLGANRFVPGHIRNCAVRSLVSVRW